MSTPAVVDHPRPELWRNGSFHLLWSSTFASGFGDRLAFFIAMSLLGFGTAGEDDSSIQAGLDFFFFLPYVLWSPLAGWLTDRLPRRFVLLAADELRGLIVLSAVFLIPEDFSGAVPESEHWKIFLFMGLIGVMAATFVPAKLSVIPGVVGQDLLTRGNGAVVTMGIIGNLMGFLIGGKLAEHSLHQAIILCAACYIVSGTFWAFMRIRWEQQGAKHSVTLFGIAREIHHGMKYAMHHRPVMVLIFLGAVVWTATSVYMPALAAINKSVFQGDAGTFGYLAGALGVGMILGAVVLSVFNTRLGNDVVMVKGIIGCGLFIGLQMWIPVFWVSIVLSILTGMCASLILVPLNTLIQRITPNYIRGRVFAAKEIIVELGKVGLSFALWRTPNTDQLMPGIATALAIVFLVLAIVGIFKYLCKGPMPYKIMNMIWRFDRLYVEAIHKLKIAGKHNIPTTGPVLVLSNHTAGLDPCLLQAPVQRQFTWMMAREYKVPGIGWYWRRYDPIFVDRTKPDSAAAKAAIERLRGGAIVGLFPEGRINYDEPGELLPLGPGVAIIARRAEAVLLPVHIAGTPRGVKPLISLFRFSRASLYFGKPFRLPEEVAGDREAAVQLIREKLLEARDESRRVFGTGG